LLQRLEDLSGSLCDCRALDGRGHKIAEQARETSIGGEDSTDWQAQPMSSLTTYIVSKHHAFTKEELARLTGLLSEVCSAHGENHPELFRIQTLFLGLNVDQIEHMQKEGMVLFPYIEQMQTAASSGTGGPVPPFGTVQTPIRTMMMEHETDGDILARIRQMTGGFSVPEDAGASYEELYKALESLERDLHQHIHLENNILFPRALELETRCHA
jgi:regulator of cell morphogenesis and NO signaling